MGCIARIMSSSTNSILKSLKSQLLEPISSGPKTQRDFKSTLGADFGGSPHKTNFPQPKLIQTGHSELDSIGCEWMVSGDRLSGISANTLIRKETASVNAQSIGNSDFERSRESHSTSDRTRISDLRQF